MRKALVEAYVKAELVAKCPDCKIRLTATGLCPKCKGEFRVELKKSKEEAKK